jgi:hypothetical protein
MIQLTGWVSEKKDRIFSDVEAPFFGRQFFNDGARKNAGQKNARHDAGR